MQILLLFLTGQLSGQFIHVCSPFKCKQTIFSISLRFILFDSANCSGKKTVAFALHFAPVAHTTRSRVTRTVYIITLKRFTQFEHSTNSRRVSTYFSLQFITHGSKRNELNTKQCDRACFSVEENLRSRSV